MPLTTRIFFIGLLLLPFSVGSVESETNILSLGIPLLAWPSFVGFTRAIFSAQGKWRIPAWFWAFFIYAVMTVITCLFSPNIGASLYRALVNLELVGAIIYIHQESERGADDLLYHRLMFVMGLSGTLLALEYALHFFYKVATNGFGEVISDRVVGGLAALNWGASNTVAACLLITCLTTLGMMLHEHFASERKWLLRSMFAAQLFAIALTVSRTVIIVFLMVALIMYAKKTSIKKTLFIIAGVAVVLTVVFSFYAIDNEGVQEVIRNRFETDSVTSMSGRTDIWLTYLSELWDNYGLPAGYYSALYRNDFSGHNNYLTLMYEMGLGGLLFSLLVVFSIVHTFRSENNFHLGALLGVAVNLMGEDLVYLQVYSVYFWILLSLCYLHSYRAAARPTRLMQA